MIEIAIGGSLLAWAQSPERFLLRDVLVDVRPAGCCSGFVLQPYSKHGLADKKTTFEHGLSERNAPCSSLCTDLHSLWIHLLWFTFSCFSFFFKHLQFSSDDCDDCNDWDLLSVWWSWASWLGGSKTTIQLPQKGREAGVEHLLGPSQRVIRLWERYKCYISFPEAFTSVYHDLRTNSQSMIFCCSRLNTT